MLTKAIKNGLTDEVLKQLYESGETAKIISEKFGIKIPSRTVIEIRKAVKNGAELNLETISANDFNLLMENHTKEKVMKMFGVRRTVFDSWIKNMKKD